MLKDGFYETGDIVEQRGPNQVVWIDRKKNIMKLSQVRQRMHGMHAQVGFLRTSNERTWTAKKAS